MFPLCSRHVLAVFSPCSRRVLAIFPLIVRAPIEHQWKSHVVTYGMKQRIGKRGVKINRGGITPPLFRFQEEEKIILT
jgi:hypothetical protein